MADKTYIGVKEAQAIDACLVAGLDVQITRTAFGVKIVGVDAKKVFRFGRSEEPRGAEQPGKTRDSASFFIFTKKESTKWILNRMKSQESAKRASRRWNAASGGKRFAGSAASSGQRTR